MSLFEQFQENKQRWLKGCIALKKYPGRFNPEIPREALARHTVEMQEKVEIALAIIVDALHRMKNGGDLCRNPLEDPLAFIRNEAEMALFLESLDQQDFQLIENGLYFFYHQENYHTLNNASEIVLKPLSRRTESDNSNAYKKYLHILRNRLSDEDFSSLTFRERNFCQREQEEQVASPIDYASVIQVIDARMNEEDPLHSEAMGVSLGRRELSGIDIMEALSSFLKEERFIRDGKWFIRRSPEHPMFITEPVAYEAPGSFYDALEVALLDVHVGLLFPRDVIIPINLGGSHWVACKVTRTGQVDFKVSYADSLGNKIPEFSVPEQKENKISYKNLKINKLLQKIVPHAEVENEPKYTKNVQGNGYSCADWVIKSSLEWLDETEFFREEKQADYLAIRATQEASFLRELVLKSIVDANVQSPSPSGSTEQEDSSLLFIIKEGNQPPQGLVDKYRGSIKSNEQADIAAAQQKMSKIKENKAKIVEDQIRCVMTDRDLLEILSIYLDPALDLAQEAEKSKENKNGFFIGGDASPPVFFASPAIGNQSFCNNVEYALKCCELQPQPEVKIIIPYQDQVTNTWVVYCLTYTPANQKKPFRDIEYFDPLYRDEAPRISVLESSGQTPRLQKVTSLVTAINQVRPKKDKQARVLVDYYSGDGVIQQTLRWVRESGTGLNEGCEDLCNTAPGKEARKKIAGFLNDRYAQLVAQTMGTTELAASRRSPVRPVGQEDQLASVSGFSGRADSPSPQRSILDRNLQPPEVDQSALTTIRARFNQMRDVIYGRTAIHDEANVNFAMAFALKAHLYNDPEGNILIEWLSRQEKEKLFFNEKKMVGGDKPNVEKILIKLNIMASEVRRSAEFVYHNIERFGHVQSQRAEVLEPWYNLAASADELPPLDDRFEAIAYQLYDSEEVKKDGRIRAELPEIRKAILLALVYKIKKIDPGIMTRQVKARDKYDACVRFLKTYPDGQLLEGNPQQPPLSDFRRVKWEEDKKTFDDVLQEKSSSGVTFMSDLKSEALRILANYTKCQPQFSCIWAKFNPDALLAIDRVIKNLPSAEQKPKDVPDNQASGSSSTNRSAASLSYESLDAGTESESTSPTKTIEFLVEYFFKNPPQEIHFPVAAEELKWPEAGQVVPEKEPERGTVAQEAPVQDLQERSSDFLAHVKSVKQYFQVFMFILKMKDEYFNSDSKRNEIRSRFISEGSSEEEAKPLLGTNNYNNVKNALDSVDQAVRQECKEYLEGLLNVSVGLFGKEKARKRAQKKKLEEVITNLKVQMMDYTTPEGAQDQGLAVFLNESVGFIKKLAEQIDADKIKLYKTDNHTAPSKLLKKEDRTRLNQIDGIIQNIIRSIDDASASPAPFNATVQLQDLNDLMITQRGYVNSGSDFGRVLDVCTPRLGETVKLAKSLVNAFQTGTSSDNLKNSDTITKNLSLYIDAFSQALKGKSIEEKKEIFKKPFFLICFDNKGFKDACIEIIDQCIVEELSPPHFTEQVLSNYCLGTAFSVNRKVFPLDPSTPAAKKLQTLLSERLLIQEDLSKEMLLSGMNAVWMGKWTKAERTAYVRECKAKGYNPFENISTENAAETFRDYLSLCSESNAQAQPMQLQYIRTFLRGNIKLSTQAEFEAYLRLATQTGPLTKEFLSELEAATNLSNREFFWKKVYSILVNKPNIRLSDEARDFLIDQYIRGMLDGAIDLTIVDEILSSNKEAQKKALHQKIIEYLNKEKEPEKFVSFFAYYVRLCNREEDLFKGFLSSLNGLDFNDPKWGQLGDELIKCQWSLFGNLEQQLRLAEHISSRAQNVKDARVLLDFTKRLPFNATQDTTSVPLNLITIRTRLSGVFADKFDQDLQVACQTFFDRVQGLFTENKNRENLSLIDDLPEYSEEFARLLSKSLFQPRTSHKINIGQYTNWISTLCAELNLLSTGNEPSCYYLNMSDLFVLCSLDAGTKRQCRDELEAARRNTWTTEHAHWANYVSFLIEALNDDPFMFVLYFNGMYKKLIPTNRAMLMTEYKRVEPAKALEVYKKIKVLNEGRFDEFSQDITPPPARVLEMGTDRLFRSIVGKAEVQAQYQCDPEELARLGQEINLVRFKAYMKALFTEAGEKTSEFMLATGEQEGGLDLDVQSICQTYKDKVQDLCDGAFAYLTNYMDSDSFIFKGQRTSSNDLEDEKDRKRLAKRILYCYQLINNSGNDFQKRNIKSMWTAMEICYMKHAVHHIKAPGIYFRYAAYEEMMIAFNAQEGNNVRLLREAKNRKSEEKDVEALKAFQEACANRYVDIKMQPSASGALMQAIEQKDLQSLIARQFTQIPYVDSPADQYVQITQNLRFVYLANAFRGQGKQAFEQGLYEAFKAHIESLGNDDKKLTVLLKSGLVDRILEHTQNQDLHALVAFIKFKKFVESREEAALLGLPLSADLTQAQCGSLLSFIESKLNDDALSDLKNEYIKMSILVTSYFSCHDKQEDKRIQDRANLITQYFKTREVHQRKQAEVSGKSLPNDRAEELFLGELLSIRGENLVLSAALTQAEAFVREYPASLAFHERLVANLNTTWGDFYTIISQYLLAYQHENISQDKMKMVLNFLSNLNSFNNRQFSGATPFEMLLSWAYKYFYETDDSSASVDKFDNYFKTRVNEDAFPSITEAYELSKDKDFMFLILLLGQAIYKGEQLNPPPGTEKRECFVNGCKELVLSYQENTNKKVIHAFGLVAKIMKTRAECYGENKDPVLGLDRCKLYLQEEKDWVSELDKTGKLYNDRLVQGERILKELKAPFLVSLFPLEQGESSAAWHPVQQYKAIQAGLLQGAELAKEMKAFEGKSTTMKDVVVAKAAEVSQNDGKDKGKMRDFSSNQLKNLAKAAAFTAFYQPANNVALVNLAELLSSDYKKEIINNMLIDRDEGLYDIEMLTPLELMFGDEITALKELWLIKNTQPVNLAQVNHCFARLSNEYLSYPVVQRVVHQVLDAIVPSAETTIESVFPYLDQWIRDEHDIAKFILTRFELSIDNFYSMPPAMAYLNGFPLPSQPETIKSIVDWFRDKPSKEKEEVLDSDKLMSYLHARNPIALYCLKAWLTDPDPAMQWGAKDKIKEKSLKLLYLFNKLIQDEGNPQKKELLQKFLQEFLEKEFGKASQADIVLQPLLALYSRDEGQKKALIENGLKDIFVKNIQALQDDETIKLIRGVLRSCVDDIKDEAMLNSWRHINMQLTPASEAVVTNEPLPLPTPRSGGPRRQAFIEESSSSPPPPSPAKGAVPSTGSGSDAPRRGGRGGSGR